MIFFQSSVGLNYKPLCVSENLNDANFFKEIAFMATFDYTKQFYWKLQASLLKKRTNMVIVYSVLHRIVCFSIPSHSFILNISCKLHYFAKILNNHTFSYIFCQNRAALIVKINEVFQLSEKVITVLKQPQTKTNKTCGNLIFCFHDLPVYFCFSLASSLIFTLYFSIICFDKTWWKSYNFNSIYL